MLLTLESYVVNPVAPLPSASTRRPGQSLTLSLSLNLTGVFVPFRLILVSLWLLLSQALVAVAANCLTSPVSSCLLVSYDPTAISPVPPMFLGGPSEDAV